MPVLWFLRAFVFNHLLRGRLENGKYPTLSLFLSWHDEAAMAQLNYIPNRVAQQLAGKQSLLIGVATSSLALHAPSQIVAAIKSRADQLGASVVVSMVERSGVEACKAAVHNLLAQRVSGLIINYPLDDRDAIAVEAACANVPALFLDVSDQTPINSIIFSHEDGTRLGVEHLVALGHQQIALLAGPLSSVSARLRLAGWHKYLTRNQIQPIAEREGDWSAMSGFQQTMQMLNEGIVPTAMLVANDQMALGVMRAITESGLRVGADISVVGYDDMPTQWVTVLVASLNTGRRFVSTPVYRAASSGTGSISR
jgi:DNA-binding LacI/PurR family transcriptional regulator